MMKNRRSMLPPAAAIAACVLAGCPLEGDPAITGTKYQSVDTCIVNYLEYSGIPFFSIEGKDTHYEVKQQETTGLDLVFHTRRAVCTVSPDFISGDHITVTASELTGSAEFDVPYKE